MPCMQCILEKGNNIKIIPAIIGLHAERFRLVRTGLGVGHSQGKACQEGQKHKVDGKVGTVN